MSKDYLMRKDIYSLIKEKIVSGSFLPGQRLNVRNLADILHISTTPVRDALLKLSNEGFVEVFPRRGFFVKALSEKEVLDIIEARIMVEGFCINNYFDEIKKCEDIDSLKEKMLEVKQTKNRKLFDELDKKFHSAIICASYNNNIIRFFNELWEKIEILRRHNERFMKSNEEHLKIILSILADNKKKAYKALLIHLSNVKKETLYSLNEGIKTITRGGVL